MLTLGASSQVKTRSSKILEPEHAAGGTDVNLNVRLPDAEVGVNPHVVGSLLLPVFNVPVPVPP